MKIILSIGDDEEPKIITKEILENKEYKWSHSTHRGFFIYMKLTKEREELQAFSK